MRKYLSENLRHMVLALITSIVAGLLFLAYLFVVGVPKTQARDLYNKGMLALESGDKTSATEYLQQAYRTWPETYINTAIQDLRP